MGILVLLLLLLVFPRAMVVLELLHSLWELDHLVLVVMLRYQWSRNYSSP